MALYKIYTTLLRIAGFPSGSVVKSLPAIARDMGSVPGWDLPGLARSPGEGNGNPLQCSCLGNPMDRGAWWATVHEVTRVRHDLVTEHEPKDCCRITKAPQVTSGLSGQLFTPMRAWCVLSHTRCSGLKWERSDYGTSSLLLHISIENTFCPS